MNHELQTLLDHARIADLSKASRLWNTRTRPDGRPGSAADLEVQCPLFGGGPDPGLRYIAFTPPQLFPGAATSPRAAA